MNNIFLTCEALEGNIKGVDKLNILLLDYKRPSLVANISESSRIGHNVEFGNTAISSFTVLSTIGNYIQGAVDWVVNVKTEHKVCVKGSATINGRKDTISFIDKYHNVTLTSITITYHDGRKRVALRVQMQFIAKNMQIADVGFKQDTKIISTEKTTILNDKRQVK